MSSCEGNPCKDLTQPFTCCKYASVIFRNAGTFTSPLVNKRSSSQAFPKEAPISYKSFGVRFCFSLQLKSMNLIQEIFSRFPPPSWISARPPRRKALWEIGKYRIVPRRPLVSHRVDLIILAWQQSRNWKRVCLLSNKSPLFAEANVSVKCMISCLALILFLLFTLFRWIHIFARLLILWNRILSCKAKQSAYWFWSKVEVFAVLGLWMVLLSGSVFGLKT